MGGTAGEMGDRTNPMPEDTFYPLLGDPDPDSPWQTTALGISYNAHGYDVLPRKEKRVIKRLNRALRHLRADGVPEWVCNQFIAYYHDLPTKLPEWLDTAYTTIRDTRWAPCVWKYPQLAAIKPSDIRIVIVPTPIYVPFYDKFAQAMTDTNTGLITICVAGVSAGTPGNPELNWLRTVYDLARWEIGNYGAHYVLKITGREVGDGPLC